MVMTTTLSFVMASLGQDTIKIETNLVRVPVVVLDRDGRFLPDLTENNFQIFEDGRRQEIDTFLPVDGQVTVFLLLDTSPSMADYMNNLAASAGEFLNQLRDDDRVYLSIFGSEQKLLVKGEKVSKLRKENRNIPIGPIPGTFVYDAVDDAIKRLMKIKGRKAIILFSDAQSGSRMATARDNFRDAEEQEALIYTIRFGDIKVRPEWAAARSVQKQVAQSGYSILDQNKVEEIVPWWDIEATGDGKLKGKELEAQKIRVKGYMDSLAAKTGGRSFEIDKIENLSEVFRHITIELRRTYMLSYYSNSDSGPERRELEVKVNIPDAAVRAKREIVIPQAKSAQSH